MDIIVHDPGRYHVSPDTAWEFEEAIHLAPDVRLVSSRESFLSYVPNIVWRNAFRLINAQPKGALRPRFHYEAMPDTFAILMTPNFRKVMPRFFAEGRKSAYLFDAWPQHYEKIRQFADACEIEHLFISSSKATAALGRLIRSTACHWVPKGITPGDYFLAFTPEKDIDVLQLGRRYRRYHMKIAPELEKRGKKYLHEEVEGEVIFPTRLDYVEGLARTKISICTPLAFSDPERAGGIETMTVRYLQSMLSRCLIVGHAPEEMVQLFGYNPLIEIDYRDPAGQLLGLLDRLAEYEPLIEKNYRVVREHHTWLKRWQQILGILHGEAHAKPPDFRAAVGIK